jgi:hypothetical protein
VLFAKDNKKYDLFSDISLEHLVDDVYTQYKILPKIIRDKSNPIIETGYPPKNITKLIEYIKNTPVDLTPVKRELKIIQGEKIHTDAYIRNNPRLSSNFTNGVGFMKLLNSYLGKSA